MECVEHHGDLFVFDVASSLSEMGQAWRVSQDVAGKSVGV